MKKLIVTGLIGLMGLMTAGASPQASDADLKAAQAPVVPVGDNPNFHGLRIAVNGTEHVVIPACNAASIDFSTFGSGAVTLATVDASNNAGTPFTGLAGLAGEMAPLASINLSSCGLGDDALAALMGGAQATGSVSNKTLVLAGNAFTTLNLGGGSIDWESGTLDFRNNAALSTVNAGNGTSTGLIAFPGSTLNLSGCALTSASEDSVLNAAVALESNTPGQNASIDISGGTNAVPDTTGAGDVTTLVAAGWTITTN